MARFKNIIAIGAVVLTMAATSVTAFASPANPGVPARDGSGGRRGAVGIERTYDGIGRGQGGPGRGLGVGGMMLQDGSCYAAN